MKAKIAQDLDDIEITLDNNALTEENYEDYYVDTKEGRGEDPTSKLITRFLKHKEENRKILFSGFKGCGKSTELLRLKRELEKDYVTDIFSVREKLDPNNLTISEILITVMQDLFEVVARNHDQIKLSSKLLKNLENWTDSVYTEDLKYRYYEGSLSAGLNVQTGIGKVLNVLAKLGLDFNAGRKYQEITKKEINHTLTELILNCNLLIFEVKAQLEKIGKKNILFIIEDLEKVQLQVAEDLFYNYPKQLTSLACSFIFTFPISLVYHPRYTNISGEFSDRLTLPMIKVHDKEGRDYAPGIANITGILSKRIDPVKELIDRKMLHDFVRLSGGCLRDLFRMIKVAAENALERKKQVIETVDFDYSVNNLKNDYYNTISYNERSGLTADDYYRILADCCKSKDKKPVDVKGLIDLKHNMSILGYNGDGWFDVHPLVRKILEEKNYI